MQCQSPCFQIEMALNPNFNQIGQAFIQQVDLDPKIKVISTFDNHQPSFCHFNNSHDTSDRIPDIKHN